MLLQKMSTQQHHRNHFIAKIKDNNKNDGDFNKINYLNKFSRDNNKLTKKKHQQQQQQQIVK